MKGQERAIGCVHILLPNIVKPGSSSQVSSPAAALWPGWKLKLTELESLSQGGRGEQSARQAGCSERGSAASSFPSGGSCCDRAQPSGTGQTSRTPAQLLSRRLVPTNRSNSPKALIDSDTASTFYHFTFGFFYWFLWQKGKIPLVAQRALLQTPAPGAAERVSLWDGACCCEKLAWFLRAFQG